LLKNLKHKVYKANLDLPKFNLVTFTWGNVSAIDREKGLFVIKPSGIKYDELKLKDMIIVDLDGNKVEGKLRPSSDMKTHLELYKSFPEIGGIVHTHSSYAVGWAQTGLDIPCYGTTHADYFYGEIPCTRNLTKEEIEEAYEKNTGKVIVETFLKRHLNPLHTPAVICKNHGPFTWGKNADEAVYHAVVLEEVSKMAMFTKINCTKAEPAPFNIIDKHFQRKHGSNAYYGQK